MRKDVLKNFRLCKDADFALLKHLLEDLVPLVVFFYSTIIRGSNYDLWRKSMVRLSFMFVVQKRHHYDRSMVSIISDMLHYETVIPEWKALFSNHLNIFTEKKVEIFHSMLRMHSSSWSTAEQIEEIAKVLSARKFDSEFAENFLKPLMKKPHKFNATHLAGKTAEFLVDIFGQIYRRSGEAHEIQKTKKKTTFKLPVLDSPFDERSFPLGYSTDVPPSNEYVCDNKNCTVVDRAEEAILMTCGHSFHLQCARNGHCVHCDRFLLNAIRKLCEKFNQTLMEDSGEAAEVQELHEDERNNDLEVQEEEAAAEEETDYYSSQDLINQLVAKLKTFVPAGVKPKYVNKAQKNNHE